MVDLCYPDSTDWGCALDEDQIADLDPVVKKRAETLAWNSLTQLTGYRLSPCPVVIRPCATRCVPSGMLTAPVAGSGGFAPYVSGGRWFNSCGCVSATSCSCTVIQEIVLPEPEVSGPIVVTIDGAVLDPTAYRVDNGNRLVRQDGDPWPLCQDMNLPAGSVGTFEVSYHPGIGPDNMLNYAAGLLAIEWYKACEGRDCRLPAGTTSVVRQGVSFTIPSFNSGVTGIREVDAIVSIYNPNHLKAPARMVSVETIRGRKRTY